MGGEEQAASTKRGEGGNNVILLSFKQGGPIWRAKTYLGSQSGQMNESLFQRKERGREEGGKNRVPDLSSKRTTPLPSRGVNWTNRVVIPIGRGVHQGKGVCLLLLGKRGVGAILIPGVTGKTRRL